MRSKQIFFKIILTIIILGEFNISNGYDAKESQSNQLNANVFLKTEKLEKESEKSQVKNKSGEENSLKILENLMKIQKNLKKKKVVKNDALIQTYLEKIRTEQRKKIENKSEKLDENLEKIPSNRDHDTYQNKNNEDKKFDESPQKKIDNELQENLLKNKIESNNGEKNSEKIINIKNTIYEANISSIRTRPLPEWYDDAKIGILVHWGVYSVPAVGNREYGSEWFWYGWKDSRSRFLTNYMRRSQKPSFTYQDFARDFTAEFFNPNEWMELFEEAGAKYVVLTAKHHDGYTLWPSKYSFGWNSVDVGPNRDLVGEFVSAVRNRTSLKLGLYYSLLEWFDRCYLADAGESFQTKNYVTMKMLPQIKELITSYKPDLVWSDGDWDALMKYWDSEKLLAWLYNEAPNHKKIVTNDRWGHDARNKIGDFYSGPDKFKLGKLQEHKFEYCLTLDKLSWGYRENSKLDHYISVGELIRRVVLTVSCNGNVLINVGPSKSGIIHPIFVDRLRSLGKWLKINGEAIYGTRPWIHQNENKNTWYTMKQENDRTYIYAIVVSYPYASNTIILRKLLNYIDQNTKVLLLGYGLLETELLSYSLTIILPNKRYIDKLNLKYAWTFKIEITAKGN